MHVSLRVRWNIVECVVRSRYAHQQCEVGRKRSNGRGQGGEGRRRWTRAERSTPQDAIWPFYGLRVNIPK